MGLGLQMIEALGHDLDMPASIDLQGGLKACSALLDQFSEFVFNESTQATIAHLVRDFGYFSAKVSFFKAKLDGVSAKGI